MWHGLNWAQATSHCMSSEAGCARLLGSGTNNIPLQPFHHHTSLGNGVGENEAWPDLCLPRSNRGSPCQVYSTLTRSPISRSRPKLGGRGRPDLGCQIPLPGFSLGELSPFERAGTCLSLPFHLPCLKIIQGRLSLCSLRLALQGRDPGEVRPNFCLKLPTHSIPPDSSGGQEIYL